MAHSHDLIMALMTCIESAPELERNKLAQKLEDFAEANPCGRFTEFAQGSGVHAAPFLAKMIGYLEETLDCRIKH